FLCYVFLLPHPQSPLSTLFPYTTLFRSPENWDTAAVFVDNRYISADTWYDPKGKSFQPQVHYFVGGATKLYGAALSFVAPPTKRSEEHTPELQSRFDLVCRLLLEKKN